MSRYQVITYDRNYGGIDEKEEYPTIKEAIKAVKSYLKDNYYGAFIYDHKTKSVRHSFNTFPDHNTFASYVDIDNCIFHF